MLRFGNRIRISPAWSITAMERCVEEIRTQMLTDKHRLNDNKTEFLSIGTMQQLPKISPCHLTIGSATVSPVSARNLGTWMDTSLALQDHINKSSRAAYFHTYNIRHIRKFLINDATQISVHALVIRRIDYCNGLLYGLPVVHVAKFQRLIQNPATRSYFPYLPFSSYYAGDEIPSLAPR